MEGDCTKKQILEMLNRGQLVPKQGHFEHIAAQTGKSSVTKQKQSLSASIKLKEKFIAQKFSEWGVPDSAKEEFLTWNLAKMRNMVEQLKRQDFKFIDPRLDVMEENVREVEESAGTALRGKKRKMSLVPDIQVESATLNKKYRVKKNQLPRKPGGTLTGDHDTLEQLEEETQ